MPRSKSSRVVPQTRGVTVPAGRRRAAAEVARLFKRGMRVALTTHVNADGDGIGSEIALWHLLTARGVRAAITNPTPLPDRYGFLLRGHEHADKSAEAVKHLRNADAIVVLDISDVGRLGQLGREVRDTNVAVGCVDHHASNGSLPPGPRLVDAKACATGELIYDLARSVSWPLTAEAARALYVAILTDTGGFRFSNTSPRALQVAGHLLGTGLDPEQIYLNVYATAPEGRVRLLAEVLDTLVTEHEIGLAWVTVPPGALERHNVDAEDLEGVAEFPRSIKGMRLALLFRQLVNGRVKVSFRSVGDVDVAQLAAQFGGGGHKKAAGASLSGSLADVQARVLAVARERLNDRHSAVRSDHPADGG
jgi:phosphoesterase RecJ-like protein